jgi:hypothetical protein
MKFNWAIMVTISGKNGNDQRPAIEKRKRA